MRGMIKNLFYKPQRVKKLLYKPQHEKKSGYKPQHTQKTLYTPQHLKNADKKTSLPVIRYLAYLLIATMTVTGVSLSRYSTSSSGSDSARVANFDVVVTHDSWNYGLTDGIIDASFNQSSGRLYTFTITNNSEVSVRARLIIDSYDLLPALNSFSPQDLNNSTDRSGWVTIAPKGAPKQITVRLFAVSNTGNPIVPNGNNVEMHIEYEQVD